MEPAESMKQLFFIPLTLKIILVCFSSRVIGHHVLGCGALLQFAELHFTGSDDDDANVWEL